MAAGNHTGRAAIAAVTDQSGGPATAARLVGCAGSAIAAIAPQQTTGPTVLARPRPSVRAVANQRALQQRLGGRVGRVENLLLKNLPGVGCGRCVGRLGGGIRAGARVQSLHKVLMKC